MTRRNLAEGMMTVVLFMLAVAQQTWGGERKEIRVLLDFEDAADIEALRQHASENVTLEMSPDNGITRGKTSCSITAKPGQTAVLELYGDKLKGWEQFDYFAVDVYNDRKDKLPVVFELWDKDSMDGEYSSRCTFEGTTNEMSHEGKNTMMWPINKAVRNRKSGAGMPFSQVQDVDKIQMNGLTKIRFFFNPFAEGGNTILWIDNVRLLQEDAVAGKIQVAIPAGARAFDFGREGLLTSGFTWVGAKSQGVSGDNVEEVGGAWPDPLTGDGLASMTGTTRFEVEVPNGDYWVWLSAGRMLDVKTRELPFVLKVGDQTLRDEKLSEKEFYGEKGLFHFLRTQYSQRPNALWLDYVEPVFPEQTVRVKVAGGKLAVEASNHRLSALVVAPAQEEAAFKKMAAELREQRQKLFYAPLYFDKQPVPKKLAKDGAYVLWVPALFKEPDPKLESEKPDFFKPIMPWSEPTEQERKVKALDWKAARGQYLYARVCVTPFEDLGVGDIEVSDLKSPAVIPATQVRRFYQNYRVQDSAVGELGLFPWTKIKFEPNLTWAYWLWLKVPDDAKPGKYNGTVTFKPEKGGSQQIDVNLEVFPFKLDDILPVSYGFAYHEWGFPASADPRKLLKEQLAFMREIGFTATEMPCPQVTSLLGDGTVQMTIDPTMYEVAREVGMGRNPDQRSECFILGLGRQVGRLTGLGKAVDQNPGCELKEPKFKGYYIDAVRQLKEFINRSGVPMAVMVVDEPRVMVMPWNRTLEDTIVYTDYVKEVGGLVQYIDIAGDDSHGKDLTPLVDYLDIVSIHAYTSSKRMMEKAYKLGKTIWFYNTGRDRLSWGFYNWRMGSKGRWEWHWYFGLHGKIEGYPNPVEPYSPFFDLEGIVQPAPYFEYPGGMLMKSSLLDIQQGITDYAYLITLEKALDAAANKPALAKTVEEARAFLKAVKEAIPTLPAVKGLASAEADRLVGEGLNTSATALCEPWRQKIAGFLIALQK